MTSSHWVEKTATTSLFLGLPAVALLAGVWLPQFREHHHKVKIPFSFWSSLVVLGLYVYSIPNIAFEWSVAYMVAWPLFGIALTFLGFGLAFSSPAGERWKLALANVLLLILTLTSIVLPN